MPVKLPNGIDDEHNNETYMHEGFLSIQTGRSGALHGEQSLTVSTVEVCWYSVENIIWNNIKAVVTT